MAHGKAVTVLCTSSRLNSKTEQAEKFPRKTENRWNVGDEVEYTVTPSKWGDRLKLDKAGYNNQRSSGGGNSPDIQKRIDASWAIGHAINQESDPEKIVEAAEWLLKLRDTLISKL